MTEMLRDLNAYIAAARRANIQERFFLMELQRLVDKLESEGNETRLRIIRS